MKMRKKKMYIENFGFSRGSFEEAEKASTERFNEIGSKKIVSILKYEIEQIGDYFSLQVKVLRKR